VELEISEIAGPDTIGLVGDFTLNFILERLFFSSVIPSFVPPGFPFVGLKAIDFHHSSHPLFVFPKLQSNSSVAIALVFVQNPKDPSLKKFVFRGKLKTIEIGRFGNSEKTNKIDSPRIN